jgi:hypothetical protein
MGALQVRTAFGPSAAFVQAIAIPMLARGLQHGRPYTT